MRKHLDLKYKGNEQLDSLREIEKEVSRVWFILK